MTVDREKVAKSIFYSMAGVSVSWDDATEDDRIKARQATTAAIKTIEAQDHVIVPVEPTDLNERLKENGMLSLEDFMGGVMPYSVQVGMDSLDAFETWLKRKTEEMVRLRLRYEVGEKEKDDLYEWAFAHAATLKTVYDHYRKAMTQSQKGGSDD